MGEKNRVRRGSKRREWRRTRPSKDGVLGDQLKFEFFERRELRLATFF